MQWNHIGIYILNGFIYLYYLLVSYLSYIILVILMTICARLEFKEKQHLYVQDERRIV